MLYEIGVNMTKEQDLLLAEMVIKVLAMERLLTKMGVFTSDQLTAEMKTVSEDAIKYLAANRDKIFGDKDNN